MAGDHVRVRTGIDGLDEVLQGGLVPRRMYLLDGNPGAGKTTLAQQFLLEGVRLGERCLYITLSETGEELREGAASHGWTLDGIEILELANADPEQHDQGELTMFHPSEVELSETTTRVLEAIRRLSPQRLVFDSLSEMRLLAQSPLRYRRQILALKQFFAGRDCTVLLLDDRTSEGPDLQLQSVAHGVISLEHVAPVYGRALRQLRVVKFRGSNFVSGYHHMRLSEAGVEIYPRLTASDHGEDFALGQLASGVRPLDDLLGGGVDVGTSTLVVGPAGSGKSTLVLQYACAAARRGDHARVFTFDESRRTMLGRLQMMGMSVQDGSGAGQVAVHQVDPAEISPGQFAHMVREAVERDRARVIVIDSLNGYLNAMIDGHYLTAQLHELLAYLGNRGVTTFLVAAQTGMLAGQMGTPGDASYLADSVMYLRFFEHAGKVKKAISVMKKRSGVHEDAIRELCFNADGIHLSAPLTNVRGILSGVPVEVGHTSLFSDPVACVVTSTGELRVLLLPATRRDGLVAAELLRRAGIDCAPMSDAAALAAALDGPVGALIVADTALMAPTFAAVLDGLERQPAWSDIPVVLTSRTDEPTGIESVAAIVDRLTNVTVIDRPTSVRTLLSAVQAALRARRRQYQIRDQLVELRAAEEALRLADRRKDEFLATLAHELRNPLAPMRSALKIMELRGDENPQQERLLGMMNRQMTMMVRLIDDLLDVGRISSGKLILRRQRVDLRGVMQEAVDGAGPAMTAASHRLQVDLPDGPAFVMGDATRLTQVFGNLLNNAAKYTPAGGEVRVSLWLEPQEVVVSVTDNGTGIPAVVIEHVFDMFAQVNRTLDRAQGGLGIGLSLVRRLLDMHGGTIRATSDGVDRGSTFTVRLPRLVEAVAEEASASDPAGAEASRQGRMRILVVDDNRDAADSLALLLEAGGHEVVVAYGGREALAAAEAWRPRVVFCDIGMPEMNGHEVAARLRSGGLHATAALVAVTGWGTDDDKRKAHEAGFDFHLTKPVDPRDIHGVLARL